MPGGPAFAITAERYRFEGKITVDLAAQMEPHARLQGGGSSFSPDPVEPFVWSTQEGCSRRPPVSWSIVYGLLRDPSDRAYAYTGAGRHAVLKASIPASIHLNGALGYVALHEAPSRLLVRDRTGKVVQDEQLGSRTKELCKPGASSSLMVEQ